MLARLWATEQIFCSFEYRETNLTKKYQVSSGGCRCTVSEISQYANFSIYETLHIEKAYHFHIGNWLLGIYKQQCAIIPKTPIWSMSYNHNIIVMQPGYMKLYIPLYIPHINSLYKGLYKAIYGHMRDTTIHICSVSKIQSWSHNDYCLIIIQSLHIAILLTYYDTMRDN